MSSIHGLSVALMLTACHLPPDAPWLTALDENTHDPFFPLVAGAHAEAACNDCHGGFDTFREFSCITCHEHAQTIADAQHGAVADYFYERKICLSCHPRGEGLDRESHDPIFPISTAVSAKHATAGCSECHTDPRDRSVIRCVDCHPHDAAPASTQHRAVGGYLFESERCLRCHVESAVTDLSAHRPFRIDDAASHRPERAACLECHPELRSDKPRGADFTIFDCTPCHLRGETDGHHQDLSGYAYDSLTCVRSGCHPQGEKEED